MEGGNHQWPSGYDDPSPPRNFFAGTTNLNATQQIWEFFKMFPRPPITSGQTLVTTSIALSTGAQNAGTSGSSTGVSSSSSSTQGVVSTSSSTTEAEASIATQFGYSLFVVFSILLYL